MWQLEYWLETIEEVNYIFLTKHNKNTPKWLEDASYIAADNNANSTNVLQ